MADNIVKWVHLTDMHFIANCASGNTRLILDTLLEYLRDNNIVASDLFITGDFRFAKTQKEPKNSIVAKTVSSYIWEVAQQLGIIDEKHIHIVPGNHDLNRKKNLRDDLVHGIYSKYQKSIMNSAIDEAALSALQIKELGSAFVFFKAILYNLYSDARAKKIWESLNNDIHYYSDDCNPYFNILCLNTAIMSVDGSEEEKGKLIVSHTHVHKLLRDMKMATPTNHKPVIVLAHHPLEHLDTTEATQLRDKYFYDCGVYIYLSGHSHESCCSTKNKNFLFSTQGSLRTEAGEQISFGVGEYSPVKGLVTIKSHEYRDGNWGLDTHFGSNDGNWLYIRERGINPNSTNLKIPITVIDRDFNKSTNEVEKEFIKSLTKKRKTSAISYLLAGLSHLDPYSDKLTPTLFCKEFYVLPSQQEEEKFTSRIKELFSDAHNNMLCLKGEAGSGKSTFIKTMAARGFGDDLKASLYRYHTLDCAETDGRGTASFPCKSIEKQIKTELQRMKKASMNNGVLWETYLLQVLGGIARMRNDFQDRENIGFIEYVDYAYQQINTYSIQHYSILSKKLAGENCAKEYEPWMQLALFLIILICKNCLFGKDAQRKHIITFDNIEGYTDHISVPVPEAFFSANISLNRTFVWLVEQGVFNMGGALTHVVNPNFMQDFTFVICARFTTKLRSVHAGQKIFGQHDKYVVERKFHDFTVDALLLKLKFLKRKVAGNSELITETEKIIRLLITKRYIDRYLDGREAGADEKEEEIDIKQYSEQKYLPLFNNDFRKAIRMLDLMYKKEYKGKTWMEYALSFRQDNYSNVGKAEINAARMVLLKNILEQYVDKGFLDTIGFNSNIDNAQKSHSISRVVISFLHWWQVNNKQKATVGTPIANVLNFFEDEYGRDAVINTLMKLSKDVDPKDHEKGNLLSGWGYFIDILGCENSDIKNSLLNPINDKKTIIRLTPAGLCMSSYVSLQFEFFNARIPGNARIPLVLFASENEQECLGFEKTLEAVYKSMEDFVEGLLENWGSSHCDSQHWSCPTRIKFDELFAVVMEHIFYIDRFRILMWSAKHSEDINKKILEYMKKYFHFFEKVENSPNLPERCKTAFAGIMFNRNLQRIEHKNIAIDMNKLKTFLSEEKGAFWQLKADTLFNAIDDNNISIKVAKFF